MMADQSYEEETILMKRSNQGFSLVELIIVIAIMAVLVGILAPQYLKYVRKSRVSIDITNADEIAHAVNAAISDGQITADGSITGAGGTAIANVENLQALPESRVDIAYVWTVTYTVQDGVTKITLGDGASVVEIYPNAGPYQNAHK